MTKELFLPDNGQDKTPEMIAITGEIESAEKFVLALQERADEITSTDLDLSCTKRYDLYDTVEIIYMRYILIPELIWKLS